MEMNALLAELYNTNGTKTASAQPAADAAQQEKVALAAQGELFTKMAAQGALGTIDGKGIDVAAMLKQGGAEGKQVVDELWSRFQRHLEKTAAENAAAAEFQQRKQAQFPPPKPEGKPDDEKKKLEEKAKDEHEKKAAELQKIAEADFRGRVMAHALVQELGLISSGSSEVNKTAAAAVEQISKTAAALNTQPQPTDAKTASSELGNHSSIRSFAHHAGNFLKNHGPGAAVGAAAGAAAHHAMSGKKETKEASAIDLLAVDIALNKIAAWAFQGAKENKASDEDAQKIAQAEAATAAEKIAAADTLNRYSQDSVKVAAAPDWQTAVDWRACELLEGAGYPIKWPEG